MTYAEIWGPATFLAAMLTGVGMGWLGAVLWWNYEVKRARVGSHDPLGLRERNLMAPSLLRETCSAVLPHPVGGGPDVPCIRPAGHDGWHAEGFHEYAMRWTERIEVEEEKMLDRYQEIKVVPDLEDA